MLSFIFNYKSDTTLLDMRELPTRRHDGILFQNIPVIHHKFKQDPMFRAMKMWNSLSVHTRNIELKQTFKNTIVNAIDNPYKNFI